MTLTLELPAEIESRLSQRADDAGVPIEQLATELLAWSVMDKSDRDASHSAPTANGNGQKPLSARQQAALDGYGKYAGRGRTSDDLIRERREEATMEIAQAARRNAGDFS
jgi:hypothetical protein